MEARRYLRRAAQMAVLFLCILSMGTVSASVGYGPVPAPHFEYRETLESGPIPKILSVLQTRSADHKVMEKTEGKLLTMNQREIHLISSLCDRISADRGSLGADIAFSLITALIVLA